MISQAKRTFLNSLLIRISSLRTKRSPLKMGGVVLLTSLAILTNGHASGRSLHDNDLFRELHPTLPQPRRELPVRGENEFQQACEVINGVISMYREDGEFDSNIEYYLQIGTPVTKVNASYTHATQTFNFPHVTLLNLRNLIRTALDQGIVSHEAGHMVLHYLGISNDTTHKSAFHEAFADLTAHFYRFYDQRTRADSLYMLENNQGCVGDHDFTCVRNNSRSLSLRQISCEVHDLSKPFSSAVYHNMVSAFANRDANLVERSIGGEIVKWHKRMLVNAVVSLSTSNPTLMDIAQKMLEVSYSDDQYRNGLGQNFIDNGLIVLMYRNPAPYYPPSTYYFPNKAFATLCVVGTDSDKLSLRRR